MTPAGTDVSKVLALDWSRGGYDCSMVRRLFREESAATVLFWLFSLALDTGRGGPLTLASPRVLSCDLQRDEPSSRLTPVVSIATEPALDADLPDHLLGWRLGPDGRLRAPDPTTPAALVAVAKLHLADLDLEVVEEARQAPRRTFRKTAKTAVNDLHNQINDDAAPFLAALRSPLLSTPPPLR